MSGNPITRDVTGEEVYSSIYSMDESRVERGVIWIGANDGPVHVTRDNGRTWANVTPKDLPPGGRVQNIEASPIRKGSAYIAVYRFLREHDLRPYIYRTEDYGATWTRLTNGSNGIPADHPTRVVREDPSRPGLLYAGTEFGFFVSFDNGGRWHSLQQNLPATPVTDIRVHRGDLVISTMGRSFWIMDDIAPLRQIGSADQPDAAAAGNACALSKGRSDKPAGCPQYSPVALAIDYLVPAGFTEPLMLEITDASGRMVRRVSSAVGVGQPSRQSGGGEMSDPDAPASGQGRGAAALLTAKPGHNRFAWDYRWSDGGPLVAPGTYTASLGGTSKTFEVVVDPGVLRDGITAADLLEQQNFLLSVRDTQAEAVRLRARIQNAMQKAGVSLPAAPGPGEWVQRRQIFASATRAVGTCRDRAWHLPTGDAHRSALQHHARRRGCRSEGGDRVTATVGRSGEGNEGDRRRTVYHCRIVGRSRCCRSASSPSSRSRRARRRTCRAQGPLLVAEEVFTASVMSVEDGDSVVVKTESEPITVNLAGVDAPEMSQPGGLQARQFLSDLTLGKTVTVRLTNGVDRMARLEVAGIDVTEALVRAGMGWHCPRYADDRDLTRAEAEARSAKRGLWNVAQPTPPWLHRGAGACWQQSSKPRVSSENRPNFSGTWTAVSPPHRAGQQLRINRTP